jgi:hypothetical protein
VVHEKWRYREKMRNEISHPGGEAQKNAEEKRKEAIDANVEFHKRENERLDRWLIFMVVCIGYSWILTVLLFTVLSASGKPGTSGDFFLLDERARLLVLTIITFLASGYIYCRSKGFIIALIICIFSPVVTLVSPALLWLELEDVIDRRKFARLSPAEQLAEQERQDEIALTESYRYF